MNLFLQLYCFVRFGVAHSFIDACYACFETCVPHHPLFIIEFSFLVNMSLIYSSGNTFIEKFLDLFPY